MHGGPTAARLRPMHVWWSYAPPAAWPADLYHTFNLLEGAAWLAFAALVLRRHLVHRRTALEPAYALAFLTFGLTDFREAYVLQTWLLAFKGVNLLALARLRPRVMRYYPEARTF